MLHAIFTEKLIVCTVGHSTHPLDIFVAMIKSNDVDYFPDVRTVPRSRHNPQFNIDSLPNFLETVDVGYVHLPELGGLRKRDLTHQTPAGATFLSAAMRITCKPPNSSMV